MLNRVHRFHGRGSARRAYRTGRTVRRASVALKFAAREPDQNFRCAVVVSRKVNHSAVVRNRIRRRVYEIVRRHAPGLNRPTDLVFTVFDDKLADLPAASLEDLIAGLLQEARLLQPAASAEQRTINKKR